MLAYFDDITSVVIFTNILLKIYNKIMNLLENFPSYDASEISKDSQLLSLFNQCEQNEEIQDEKPTYQQPLDLKPEQNFEYRGCWSDHETITQKNKQIKKSKHIVNRQQKQREKKRTKLYIEMLENRVTQLQNQNQKLRKLNKINKEYIHRLNESEHHINGYFVGRQQLFEKLENLNTQSVNQNQRESQTSNNKFIEEIISLRMRQGAFGKDRIKTVNYYFKEMVEMLLPEIQKYLIKVAIQSSDFFEKTYIESGVHVNELEGWRKKLLQNIEQEGNSIKIREFCKLNQERMTTQSNKFKQLLETFYNVKCQLIEQGKKIEEVFDGAHKYMSPKQIAKILCYIDRYRFEKNITLEHTYKSLFQKTETETFHYDPTDPFGMRK